MLVGESALNICVIVLAGIGLHVVLLAANWTATTPVLRLPEKERRAVLLMASQKTLPVAVTVISYLDEARWGGHGLIAIPCIVGHVSQLFIDAFIAGKWAAASAKSLDAAAAAEASAGALSVAELGETQASEEKHDNNKA
jgi:sodium/bile acid cotransporter 7